MGLITHIDLTEEGVRYLHSIDATGPGPSNASITLCIVHLVIVCRHVRGVKHEDIDRVPEAARQWTGERRDDRVKRDLIWIFKKLIDVVENVVDWLVTLFCEPVRAVHFAACGLMSVQRKTAVCFGVR